MESSEQKKLNSFFIDILQTVVLALAVFMIVYLFLFQPHQVEGQSMMPNFINNEYLLTDKISYRLGQPQRGDVIVFEAPPSPTEDYIKRIIGIPGDTVKIQDGHVFVNRERLQENYLPENLETKGGVFAPEGKEIKLGSNEYFVMGDNRPDSYDSRSWGTLPRDKIIGKAWFVYWPIKKLGVVPHPMFSF